MSVSSTKKLFEACLQDDEYLFTGMTSLMRRYQLPQAAAIRSKLKEACFIEDGRPSQMAIDQGVVRFRKLDLRGGVRPKGSKPAEVNMNLWRVKRMDELLPVASVLSRFIDVRTDEEAKVRLARLMGIAGKSVRDEYQRATGKRLSRRSKPSHLVDHFGVSWCTACALLGDDETLQRYLRMVAQEAAQLLRTVDLEFAPTFEAAIASLVSWFHGEQTDDDGHRERPRS